MDFHLRLHLRVFPPPEKAKVGPKKIYKDQHKIPYASTITINCRIGLRNLSKSFKKEDIITSSKCHSSYIEDPIAYNDESLSVVTFQEKLSEAETGKVIFFLKDTFQSLLKNPKLLSSYNSTYQLKLGDYTQSSPLVFDIIHVSDNINDHVSLTVMPKVVNGFHELEYNSYLKSLIRTDMLVLGGTIGFCTRVGVELLKDIVVHTDLYSEDSKKVVSWCMKLALLGVVGFQMFLYQDKLPKSVIWLGHFGNVLRPFLDLFLYNFNCEFSMLQNLIFNTMVGALMTVDIIDQRFACLGQLEFFSRERTLTFFSDRSTSILDE